MLLVDRYGALFVVTTAPCSSVAMRQAAQGPEDRADNLRRPRSHRAVIGARPGGACVCPRRGRGTRLVQSGAGCTVREPVGLPRDSRSRTGSGDRPRTRQRGADPPACVVFDFGCSRRAACAGRWSRPRRGPGGGAGLPAPIPAEYLWTRRSMPSRSMAGGVIWPTTAVASSGSEIPRRIAAIRGAGGGPCLFGAYFLVTTEHGYGRSPAREIDCRGGKAPGPLD
ncbi:hypothetical protein HBB16_09950 [Pseudonocardia sp. MCCB 268]|nr:hypothetical protein [Pseudonocardia cytotoxica]